MSARSYISQLQRFLFCPHVEFAFWPSEAMFHSPIHSSQGPFSEHFFVSFPFIRVYFTTKVPEKWAIVKVGKYE